MQAAIDQQFLSTSSGKYLLYLGAQSGFVLPPNSGLDIKALTSIVPLVAGSPKQVVDTLDQLITAFYGVDKTRASVISGRAEPYTLSDGDDLIIATETGRASVAVLASQFSNINLVTSTELAAFINSNQSLYIADVYIDRKTNEKSLRLSSKTHGVGSSIQVVGGTAQNILRIPRTVDTQNTTGTVWEVSKEATYTDLLTLRWNGSGQNPNVFLVAKDDILTIRGLADGATALSKLNGTYVIQDSGYDYVKILNSTYQSLSDTFTQSDANNVVFTSQIKNTLYDGTEYAIISETEDDTVTFTVPAVPPIAKRFLQGSAHLHGAELNVLDFTRSSIAVDNSIGDGSPSDDNSIVLANGFMTYDLTLGSTYKLSGSNKATPRVYVVDSGSDTYASLPYTEIQPISTNAIYADPRSQDFYITFPYPHGLKYQWGFTLDTSAGAGNITTTNLNAEQVVGVVVSPTKIKFSINGSDGLPLRFSGVSFSNFDVYQWPAVQTDGSDFYLQFNSTGDLTASGLQVGYAIRFDPVAGMNIDPYYGSVLRYNSFTVTSISGTKVSFKTGYGIGGFGKVINQSTAFRSAFFGGSVQYYLDKTTTRNKTKVMSGLRSVFLEYTPSTNPSYVGSYIYDPTGSQFQNTVTSQVTTNVQEILKGSTQTAIFVDSLEGFPTTGKFIIDHGTDAAEGPINFLSTISNSGGNSQILIDPSYKFKNTHSSGSLVWFVGATNPFVPDLQGAAYPAYVTGTAQARDTLLEILETLVASGIFINFNVLLPSLRYEDPAIQPYA